MLNHWYDPLKSDAVEPSGAYKSLSFNSRKCSVTIEASHIVQNRFKMTKRERERIVAFHISQKVEEVEVF